QAEAAGAVFFGLGLFAARIVAASGLLRLLGLEVELLDRDRQRFLLTVAEHLDRHARARPGRHHHLHELVAVRDWAPVVLDDHVAGLEAGFGRRASGRDLLDDRAAALLQAVVLVRVAA